MTAVRISITVFVVALLYLTIAGIVWTSQNQAPAQATASAIVLSIGALFGVGALVVVWWPHPAAEKE
jgi:hypothetical protein